MHPIIGQKTKKHRDALVEELRVISHVVGHKKESSLIRTLNLKIDEKAILGVSATCSINTHIRWIAYNMSLMLHIEETWYAFSTGRDWCTIPNFRMERILPSSNCQTILAKKYINWHGFG